MHAYARRERERERERERAAHGGLPLGIQMGGEKREGEGRTKGRDKRRVLPPPEG